MLLHYRFYYTIGDKCDYEGRSKSFEPDYLPLDFWAKKKCYWP